MRSRGRLSVEQLQARQLRNDNFEERDVILSLSERITVQCEISEVFQFLEPLLDQALL